MAKNIDHEWFFNWIEIVNKYGIKEFLYLTSDKVFAGPYGSDLGLLSGFYNNRMLGYGAIRKNFGLKKNEGIEKSCERFWETKNFPEGFRKEIAAKMKDFDSNFRRLLQRGYFLDEQLAFIVKYAPEEWKARAWTQLLNQNAEPANRVRFLRLLGETLEYWFVKPGDISGKSKTKELWKSTIAQTILNIRLGQVREIYFHIFNHTKNLPATKYFSVSSEPSRWDFAMLESSIKTKIKLMTDHFRRNSKKQLLDPKIVLVEDMWDLIMIENIFDEYHFLNKNSKTVRQIFSIVSSLGGK